MLKYHNFSSPDLPQCLTPNLLVAFGHLTPALSVNSHPVSDHSTARTIRKFGVPENGPKQINESLYSAEHCPTVLKFGRLVGRLASSGNAALIAPCLVRPPDVSRKGFKFYPRIFFLYLSFFINPPCSAATQRTAIKCISEVGS